MSDFREAADIRIYAAGERRGVTFLVVAGVLSILGVLSGLLYYLLSKRTKTFHRTNIAPYLVSLLVANVLQAIATILNARWINEGMVYNGSFCTFQGGLKNAANVGIALWSFVIAVHVFNLLFLRWRTTRTGMIATLVGGWSAVVFIVTLGRLSTETPELGPYFGVSGFWCWITDNYPTQRIYMEYFIEFLSAGLGFILYALVLLRVRGNLARVDGRWCLRWVKRSQAWQLSFSRDILDSAMLRVAAFMVWYPVVYSLIIVPIALARISYFDNRSVPFWATITTGVIFNLTGLVNSILFISTRRILPDTAELPQFTMPRNKTISGTEARFGVTPFSLEPVPENRFSQETENDRKSEVDFDDGSLAHETLPAPEFTLGGVTRDHPMAVWQNVNSRPSNSVPPRQGSRGFPDTITLPTLAYSYSGGTSKRANDNTSSIPSSPA